MKKFKYITLIALLFFVGACEQELIVLEEPEIIPACPSTASAGNANFTKFIALGNSLTAGYQAGALFTDGQNESLAKILATQFECVGGGAFNQPDINSTHGCYNPAGGCSLGRLMLFDSDGPSGPASTGPAPVGTPGMPAPYNTGGSAITPYAGNKATLNNFGVPGAKLIEAVNVPNYGQLNPYYGRFASDPASKTLLADAAEKQATFFLMWLGNNDVLGYATSGAVGSENGTNPGDMTPLAAFTPSFTGALNAMLASTANTKGVVGNIPNVTSIPFFNLIPYNPIPLDAATAGQLNTQLANNYNAIVNAARAAGVITTDAERDSRLISYSAGNNPVLITDESLTDLTAFMVGAGAPTLVPYAKARQTKSNDRFCLTARPYFGLNVDITGDGVPDGVNGVSIPLFNNTNLTTAALKGDDLVLTSTEISVIAARVTQFNDAIATVVTTTNAGGVKVALADVNSAFNTFVTAGVTISDGVPLTPSIAPPTAAFSEDGVHPNGRGAAFTANIFIDAINAAFNAAVPKANVTKYKGTRLPLNPLP